MIKIEINDNEKKKELTVKINRIQETKLEKFFADEISKYIDKLISEK